MGYKILENAPPHNKIMMVKIRRTRTNIQNSKLMRHATHKLTTTAGATKKFIQSH